MSSQKSVSIPEVDKTDSKAVLYVIEWNIRGASWTIRRRDEEFAALHDALCKVDVPEGNAMPAFPKQSLFQSYKKRRHCLQTYLQEILAASWLSSNADLRVFLNVPMSLWACQPGKQDPVRPSSGWGVDKFTCVILACALLGYTLQDHQRVVFLVRLVTMLFPLYYLYDDVSKLGQHTHSIDHLFSNLGFPQHLEQRVYSNLNEYLADYAVLRLWLYCIVAFGAECREIYFIVAVLAHAALRKRSSAQLAQSWAAKALGLVAPGLEDRVNRLAPIVSVYFLLSSVCFLIANATGEGSDALYVNWGLWSCMLLYKNCKVSGAAS
jgi:hypothetical protein